MAAELVRKWETAQPRVAPIMDSGRAFWAWEGDEGEVGRRGTRGKLCSPTERGNWFEKGEG